MALGGECDSTISDYLEQTLIVRRQKHLTFTSSKKYLLCKSSKFVHQLVVGITSGSVLVS
jgi:hypothetical protein